MNMPYKALCIGVVYERIFYHYFISDLPLIQVCIWLKLYN